MTLDLSQILKDEALKLGFTACGITPARAQTEQDEPIRNWLHNGLNGEMHYLERNHDKRIDVRLMVPGAKSVIVVLQNYFTPHSLPQGHPYIARYARHEDYHIVIKDKLHTLFTKLKEYAPQVQGRIFADSAPVLERIYAVQAGLGWIGKSGLMLNKTAGPYTLIGELVVDIELPYDIPFTKNHCGSCNRCMVACPNQAIIAPGKLDARRCISYITIESQQKQLQSNTSTNGHLFGCDICLDVCPWASMAHPTTEKRLKPSTSIDSLSIGKISEMEESEFENLCVYSPLQRAKLAGLKENLKLII